MSILLRASKKFPKMLESISLWLDASDLSTISHLSNAVSQWRDKSGNDNHADQSTGGSQPTLVAGAQNGFPGIQFDGTNDFMTCADASTLKMGDGEFTFFFICDWDVTASSGRMFMKGRAGGGGSDYRRYNLLVISSGAQFQLEIDSDDQSGKNVITSTFSAGSARAGITYKETPSPNHEIGIRSDNTSTQTLAIGTYGTLDETNPTPLYIGTRDGAASFFKGDLYELFICKGLLASEEIQTEFLNYAASKWGIS